MLQVTLGFSQSSSGICQTVSTQIQPQLKNCKNSWVQQEPAFFAGGGLPTNHHEAPVTRSTNPSRFKNPCLALQGNRQAYLRPAGNTGPCQTSMVCGLAEHLAVMPRVAKSILDVLNLDLQLQNIKCSTVKTLPPDVYSKNTGWICTHLWYYSYIIHQRSDHLNVAKVWIKNNNPWLSRDHSETRPCHGCQDETVPMQSIKVCLAPNAPDHFHRLIMTDLIFCYIFIDFSKKQQSLPLISCKITKELLWRFASQIDHTGEELCVRDLSSPSLSSIQADSCRSKLF